MADDKGVGEGENKQTSPTATANRNKRQGFIARLWNGIFRLHGDDFEKRLQYISKEEAAVLTRMNRRSQSWRQTTRHLIVFSIIFEVIAVGYAIMTTRSVDMDWRMRAFRVMPMFLFPALSSAAYSAVVSFTRMCDRRDQKILERLRAERQTKIDELKEKTNYYTTQQLIQRYDPDPAAKAAAATVLASKLGADSGLKVYLGDESNLNASTGVSNDVEFVQAGGLRNRKQVQSKYTTPGATTPKLHPDQQIGGAGETEEGPTSEHNQLIVVEHHQPQSSSTNDGGWIARIAGILDQMAHRLIEEAEKLDIPFQFNPVVSKLENLDFDKLRVKTGEALAISSILQLHSLLTSDDEALRRRTPLLTKCSNGSHLQRAVPMNQSSLGDLLEKDTINNRYSPSPDSASSSPASSIASMSMEGFLNALWGLSPKVMVVTEQDSNHNGSTLMERLLEALYSYAALFDCLESTVSRTSMERLKVEKMLFGEEIKNIVACEGAERKERHEKLDKWLQRLDLAGFGNVPLSYYGMLQARRLLQSYGCEGYKMREENGCVVICWQDRSLFSVSAWRPRK